MDVVLFVILMAGLMLLNRHEKPLTERQKQALNSQSAYAPRPRD